MSFPDSTSSVGRIWEWDWLNRHHVFVELQKSKVADNVNNAWNVNVSSEEEVPGHGCLVHCEPREDESRETSEGEVTVVSH